MLALLGTATVLVLLLVIMTNRLSPLVALITVPTVAALLAGFGLGTSKFIIAGISAIAPVAGMFVFAILYFGVMTDAGMLDPIIARILRVVGVRPTRIVMGTALLALLIHLDGSGAVCFLITIPAMLPLYDQLGMDRRVLACAASLAAGVNFLPWTGPTLRASAALKIPVSQIFNPMIGIQAVGLVFVFAVAWWLGHREAQRLGLTTASRRAVAVGAAPVQVPAVPVLTPDQTRLRRPHMFWINLLLTVFIMTVMIGGWVDPVVMFMLGLVAALVINYPNVAEQRARIDAHAKAALLMASILLAAGAFTGIMTGSGMLKAMATAAVAHIPGGAGAHIPFVLGLISMPLSMLFDPDSFYFGVLPVVAEMTKSLGGQPIQVAQAALLGQMTVGFPVSPLTPATFLVVGLSGIELSAHQRFTIPYLLAASVVMTIAAVALGVFPL
jgi:citrate-Mg2+:H+ or citrate-Ca2+:H+ symporter, CitMHS family